MFFGSIASAGAYRRTVSIRNKSGFTGFKTYTAQVGTGFYAILLGADIYTAIRIVGEQKRRASDTDGGRRGDYFVVGALAFTNQSGNGTDSSLDEPGDRLVFGGISGITVAAYLKLGVLVQRYVAAITELNLRLAFAGNHRVATLQVKTLAGMGYVCVSLERHVPVYVVQYARRLPRLGCHAQQ